MVIDLISTIAFRFESRIAVKSAPRLVMRVPSFSLIAYNWAAVFEYTVPVPVVVRSTVASCINTNAESLL